MIQISFALAVHTAFMFVTHVAMQVLLAFTDTSTPANLSFVRQ